MEPRKRNRGSKSREIQDRITPHERTRTYKQMAMAARITDALEAKG